MTDHATAYLTMLAERDATMLALGLLALVSVITWYSIRLVPSERLRKLAQSGTLLGGVLVSAWIYSVQH